VPCNPQGQSQRRDTLNRDIFNSAIKAELEYPRATIPDNLFWHVIPLFFMLALADRSLGVVLINGSVREKPCVV
jgi:hypothetical protein